MTVSFKQARKMQQAILDERERAKQECVLLQRLAKISPKWASVMRVMVSGNVYLPRESNRFTGADGKTYNIEEAASCIVGEAHRGSTSYGGCHLCSDFCGMLLHDLRYNSVWNSELERFVTHFEEAHL